MARELPVRYEGQPSYTIRIEADYGALEKSVQALATMSSRVLIVTDAHVAPLYLSEVRERLSRCFSSCDALILPPGEEQKNTDSIAKIYPRLIENGFDRSDYLAALGGGVIGDMCGFAAATYMRGIRFIQLPTTLLSQVDSSIGGKTGVDFREYKNMVGVFHMPSLVYSNVQTLKSLDALQFASGMGEVIKHALIRDKDYYAYLSQHRQEIMARSLPILEEVVYRSNLIKRQIVEADPKEKGERRLLNFGHTLGHAIEECSGFQYTHGQSVALGCLAALSISKAHNENGNAMDEDASASPEAPSSKKQAGTLSLAGLYAGTQALMEAVGLETRLRPMDIEGVLSASKKDKKMAHGQIRFILLKALGEAYVSDTVTDAEMRDALQALMD